uniref:Uncharacterized protein ODG-DC23.2 n=1 Tax=Oikopleura dioica TaxID=34765 RepID=Q8WS45_OIKDI|nr:putative protein [Oikopleura dioica]
MFNLSSQFFSCTFWQILLAALVNPSQCVRTIRSRLRLFLVLAFLTRWFFVAWAISRTLKVRLIQTKTVGSDTDDGSEADFDIFQEDIVQKDDESDLEDDGGDSESSDDRHLYDLYMAAESQNAAVTNEEGSIVDGNEQDDMFFRIFQDMNVRLEEYDDEDDYIRCVKLVMSFFIYFIDMGELEKEDIPPEESDEELLSLRSKG